MNKKIALLLGVVFISGCASTNQVYSFGVVDQKVNGNEESVSVFNVWSAGDAQPLADRHCQKYGKRAEFDQMKNITAYFYCK
jgi:hypothetical protein